MILAFVQLQIQLIYNYKNIFFYFDIHYDNEFHKIQKVNEFSRVTVLMRFDLFDILSYSYPSNTDIVNV